jgi:hypothetical protein
MLGVTPGFDYRKAPSSPAAALKPEAQTGTYQNDFFGEVSVSEHGAFAMIFGPQNKSFPLQHYERDTFSYQPEGENAAGPSGVTFTIGPDGKATEMTVESLNVHGEGRFKRRPQ